jgi:hypothetical protein
MSAEARLKELGLTLPKPLTPVANFLPYRVVGNPSRRLLGWISAGQAERNMASSEAIASTITATP